MMPNDHKKIMLSKLYKTLVFIALAVTASDYGLEYVSEQNRSNHQFNFKNPDYTFMPARATRGWTLNSIGYNRGFQDVLKKLIDYKMMRPDAIAKRSGFVPWLE